MSFPQVSPPKPCMHFSYLHTLSAQTKTCKRKSRCVFSESHLHRNDIWKLCSKTSCISSGVSLTLASVRKSVHVCTVHQQYQSTFLLIQLMHTIIKSQKYSKQLKFPQLLRHVSVHSGTIIMELFRA